ncbi:phage tail tube protein [Phascolarctobacterium sp.]|uniref:phage tail tube protein n=1 Tax=Phascolarctobacterium sp. TaxID=2049039 RepID=UPI003865C462
MATISCPWGVGAKTKTLLIPESSYGVMSADAETKAVLLPFNSNAVAASQNTTNPQTIRGNRNPVEPIKGNFDVGGDVVVPIDYIALGYWLAAAFGNPTTTDKTTYKEHVFKILDTQPSFVLEKLFPGISQYVRTTGCKVSKLSLSVGGDGELTATISVLGQKETLADAPASASPITPVMARANNFEASLKVDGVDVAVATSFSIDIDFGSDGDTYTIGSKGFRQAICDGLVTVSGTLEAFFKDSTFLDMADDNETVSIELTLTSGSNSLSILLPEAQFARTSPAIEGPAGVKQSLNYNAFYSENGEQSTVVVTLGNATASYEVF